MKVLLLTDVPPCKRFPGALVLDQLCRFLPKGSIACATVMDPYLGAKVSEDLDWIPTLYLEKPRERSARVMLGSLGTASAYGYELLQAWKVRSQIIPRIVEFAREQGVDRVWAVLQGQTIIRAAMPVATQLGVPLHSHIWDPFGWWLRANNIDRYTSKRLLALFDDVVSGSVSCATASWAMSEAYDAKYGVPNVPIIASLEQSIALPAANKPHDRDDLVIGMAGQFYASQEWDALIAALNEVSWKVADRNVRLRVLSGSFQMHAASPMNIEFLGWRGQTDAIHLLSEADILYLPYWFSEEFREEATLSFPSKLVSYLATGRPIFFHGPDYASPARYLAANGAGVLCNSLQPERIIKLLDMLVSCSDTYNQVTSNGHAAFMRDFTLEHQKNALFGFLCCNKEGELPLDSI